MSTTSNKPHSPAFTHSDNQAQAPGVAAEKIQQAGQHFVAEPARDIFASLRDYAHEKPDVAAMWCFGLGVIVGWKLRG